MSHVQSMMFRPRNGMFILLLLPLITILYLSRDFLTSSKAVGYTPPHTVLPSYVSAANVPQCLPAKVEDHGIVAGWMGYQGSASGWYGDDEEDMDGSADVWGDAEHMRTASKSESKAKPKVKGATSGGQATLVAQDAVPVDGITSYMKSHIKQKQEGFNSTADHDYLGLNIGASWDLDEYSSELMTTYEKYLAVPHIPNPSFLPPVLSRLSLRPPIAPLPPRPKQIITTDKSRNDLPSEFSRWSEIMPDWSIRYFDDAGLASWVSTMFGGTRAEDLWKSLPRAVLKADVFRYMVMLVEGGIYTDSDTAPVIHAEEWGKGYQNATDKFLVDMTWLLSLAGTPYLSPAHQGAESTIKGEDSGEEMMESHARGMKGDRALERRSKATAPKLGPGSPPLVNDGAELGLPSLVVSVESDAIEFGWNDWREVGLSRAVQIVQWTFMARPGHPIFLDAIGRTLRKTEEIMELEEEAKARGEVYVEDSALEWTGPAVFTDCVYRYMLTRYGFQPRDLIHQKVPIRIGDVLILPAGSYSSVSPFGDEAQRDWAASWHGFFGRWRNDDPSIAEFERLKKIKEEEEERVREETEKQESEGRVEPDEETQEQAR